MKEEHAGRPQDPPDLSEYFDRLPDCSKADQEMTASKLWLRAGSSISDDVTNESSAGS